LLLRLYYYQFTNNQKVNYQQRPRKKMFSQNPITTNVENLLISRSNF